MGTVRVGWAIPVCRGTLLTQLHWLATGVEVAAEPGVCVTAGEGEPKAVTSSPWPGRFRLSIQELGSGTRVLATSCPLVSRLL